MRYVVATSGGIDSVVLLHQLVQAGEHELVVAHFDHGMRDDSDDDARFVRGLAAHYHLPFVMQRGQLGPDAGEAVARQHRYNFLHHVAKRYEAHIVTAHHADDIIETIAINLTRGTGWRGLAVLDTPTVIRPLLGQTKQQLRDYVRDHQLEWVEDGTNSTLLYLRNRIRRSIGSQIDDTARQKLLQLRTEQLAIKAMIAVEVAHLIGDGPDYERYTLTTVDTSSARELLREIVTRSRPGGLTRPQLDQAILAIKTAQPGSRYQAGDGIELCFTKRTFVVETSE